MGSSNENSALQTGGTNPRDLTRASLGGSSGGSAAAVAAGTAVAYAGLRHGRLHSPARGLLWCSSGWMPTYGRVSRYGLIAFASSLDHVGPLTKTVKDCRSSCCAPSPAADPLGLQAGPISPCPISAQGGLGKSVKGLQAGHPEGIFLAEGLDPEVRARNRSSDPATGRRPAARSYHFPAAHGNTRSRAYYVICTAEASSNLARYDGVRYGYPR